MKNKIYFIVSSILQIILSIYTILTANEIIEQQIDSIKEVYKAFPEQLQQEMVNSLQNNGANMIILFAVVIIIFCIITLITAIQNKILRRKGMIIAFSAVSIFLTESYFILLISVISLIVLLCSERKNPEDFPNKEKKEMPKMERVKPNYKDIILGIVLVLIYFSSMFWADYLPNSRNIRYAVSIGFDIFVLILSIAIFYKELKEGFKAFKSSFGAYMKFILSRLGIMYVVGIILNLVAMMLCNQGNSVNQATLEALPQWYVIPMAVIWAPIVEEIIFRGVLRRIIKNNKLFIIVSAILFGVLHTVVEASLFNMVVMAIPYAFIGGFLAYIYTKTNNIVSNISCHGIYNLIGAVLTLL